MLISHLLVYNRRRIFKIIAKFQMSTVHTLSIKSRLAPIFLCTCLSRHAILLKTKSKQIDTEIQSIYLVRIKIWHRSFYRKLFSCNVFSRNNWNALFTWAKQFCYNIACDTFRIRSIKTLMEEIKAMGPCTEPWCTPSKHPMTREGNSLYKVGITQCNVTEVFTCCNKVVYILLEIQLIILSDKHLQ